jgi:4-amino-4-deoxy-L-arabinose transferase-like glycosyltransferase
MVPDSLAFLARALAGGALAGGIAFLIGRRALLLLDIRFDSLWEEFSFSTAAGLGITALLAFGLGIGGWLKPIPFGGILALYVALSLIPQGGAPVSPPARAAGDPLYRTAFFILLILAVPLLLLPLYPPTGSDAITYHLAVARKFAASGVVSPTPEFRYAVFPELAEMLFAGSLLLGNEITAQWMSFLALAVTAAAVAAFVRRASGEGEGLWGAGILLSNTAILLLGGVAFGDMLLTAFVTVSFLSFERWRAGDGEPWLVVSGFMTGLAIGTKYSALFFPPVLLLMILLGADRRKFVRSSLMFLVPLLVSGIPWYAYNFAWTGNPVWPFFSGIFGLRYWNATDIAAQTSDLVSQYGSGKSFTSLLMLPWNLFFHSELFHSEGSLSYILLAGIPFALYAAVRDRAARRLVLAAAAYTLFWFFTAQLLRYLIPVIPLYCAAAATGAGQLIRRKVSPLVLPLVFAVGAMAMFIPSLYYTLRTEGRAGFPPSNAAGRDKYLEKHLPSYGAVKLLNDRGGRGFTLYSYHDPQMAYFTNGGFRGDFFGPWRYSRIEGALNGPEDSLRAALHALGADYLLVRDDSAGCGCSEEWLTRRFVVPWYRSPGVVLFRVSSVPIAPSYGPELAAETQTVGSDDTVHGDVRFPAKEGRMYLCACTGSADSEYANAAIEISWLDEHGKQIRADQAPGVFLRESSALRLISTSPSRTTSASLTLSPLGGAALKVSRMSAREIGFVTAFP